MARNPGGIGEAPAWGDDGAAEGVLVDFLFDFAVFALCGQEQLPSPLSLSTMLEHS